ncbi:MAG: KGG domain-containing protein [Solirubrobacteraceae bacterium]|nr:KGG domain-containing protein [Solirubrobacteraceae bacterium]
MVRDTRGHEFYEEIGRKGGHKVRDLINAGKRAIEEKRRK